MSSSVELEESSTVGRTGDCSDATDYNSMPWVCVEESKALSVERVEELFQLVDNEECIIFVPPTCPKGGDVYLYNMFQNQQTLLLSVTERGTEWGTELSQRTELITAEVIVLLWSSNICTCDRKSITCHPDYFCLKHFNISHQSAFLGVQN